MMFGGKLSWPWFFEVSTYSVPLFTHSALGTDDTRNTKMVKTQIFHREKKIQGYSKTTVKQILHHKKATQKREWRKYQIIWTQILVSKHKNHIKRQLCVGEGWVNCQEESCMEDTPRKHVETQRTLRGHTEDWRRTHKGRTEDTQRHTDDTQRT